MYFIGLIFMEEKGVKQVVPLIISQFDLIRLMQKEREN
jgi:hypothetical protein